MTKKWKVGAVYELVDETGFLSNASFNDQLLHYVSGKFKVLKLDSCGDVDSIENIDLSIQSTGPDGIILLGKERKFFKRVK